MRSVSLIKNFVLLVFLTNFCFTEVNAFCLKEIKEKELIEKSAKLQCSCEYRLNSININWFDNFSDEYLKYYVCQAITKNHDLKKAALKSEEYRQKVKSTFSNELPEITFAPAFARIKTARNQIADLEFSQTRSNIYALPFIARYEADIFLKNHDKTKSAKLEKEAMEYEEKAANIAMASDVATLYINILKLDENILIKQKVAQIREKIFELTKERNKAGLASVYDVTYTDKLHTEAQIELLDLMRNRNLLLHELAVYIDENPADAFQMKRGTLNDLEYKKIVPQYINSEIILFRPDIMKAEADLKKAGLDVKIARKEFLPSIQILGIAGYNSLLLKRLFDWENIMALVGIGAFEKIYTGGYLMANLRIKKIKFEQIFEEYKQTDITALQEINDCLCRVKYDTQKDKNNLKKLNLEKKNLKLIYERLKAGIISYLDYIQYQETLLSLQIEKNNSKAQRLVDYISLYKSTGAKL